MYQQPQTTNIQPQQQPKTLAPPRQESSVKSHIGTLVVLCNDHIARYHEYGFNEPAELINELMSFRTDFENIYLNTNLYILHFKSDLEIQCSEKDTVSFYELCNDIEQWFKLTEYAMDPTPDNAFNDGEVLFKVYQKALIISDLYNPKEV
jgi:hypothetical protein